MSEVTLRWTQRCAGRDIGDVATVERTPFMEALIATGRVDVLSDDTEPPHPPPSARPAKIKPSDLMGGSITTVDPDTYITTNEVADGDPGH